MECHWIDHRHCLSGEIIMLDLIAADEISDANQIISQVFNKYNINILIVDSYGELLLLYM